LTPLLLASNVEGNVFVFESICYRRQNNSSKPIDIGFLAETMLFYDNVHLIAEYAMLEQLVSYCGPDLLFEFIDDGFLRIK